jgi:hypothetical protein
MTRDRYRECLATVGQSQRGLADVLGCSDRLTRAWASGGNRIPANVAAWLEAWAALRLAHPDPEPPVSWRSGRGRKPRAAAVARL